MLEKPMKTKLLLASLFASTIICGLSAQHQGFVTTAHPATVTPGAVMTLTATFTDPRHQPELSSVPCIYLMGLEHNPHHSPFVIPPIVVGTAAFKKVKHNNVEVLQATVHFSVPRVHLPPHFQAGFYVQGVAVVKPQQHTFDVVAAHPARATLVSPSR